MKEKDLKIWQKVCSFSRIKEDTEILVDSYLKREVFSEYKGEIVPVYELCPVVNTYKYLQKLTINHKLQAFYDEIEESEDKDDLFLIFLNYYITNFVLKRTDLHPDDIADFHLSFIQEFDYSITDLRRKWELWLETDDKEINYDDTYYRSTDGNLTPFTEDVVTKAHQKMPVFSILQREYTHNPTKVIVHNCWFKSIPSASITLTYDDEWYDWDDYIPEEIEGLEFSINEDGSFFEIQTGNIAEFTLSIIE